MIVSPPSTTIPQLTQGNSAWFVNCSTASLNATQLDSKQLLVQPLWSPGLAGSFYERLRATAAHFICSKTILFLQRSKRDGKALQTKAFLDDILCHDNGRVRIERQNEEHQEHSHADILSTVDGLEFPRQIKPVQQK